MVSSHIGVTGRDAQYHLEPWFCEKFYNSGDLYDIIGINDIPAGDKDQLVTYNIPDDERINVLAGDVIGFAWNSPGPKHVNQGKADDDDVEMLKYFPGLSPDDLNVNDKINASDKRTLVKAYSIKAIMSGIYCYYYYLRGFCTPD